MIVVHSHTDIAAYFFVVDPETGAVVDRHTLKGTLSEDLTAPAWAGVYQQLDQGRQEIVPPPPPVPAVPVPDPAPPALTVVYPEAAPEPLPAPVAADTETDWPQPASSTPSPAPAADTVEIG